MVFVKGLLYMVRLNPPREQRLVTNLDHNSGLLTHIISFIKVMKMTVRRRKGMRMRDKMENIDRNSISGDHSGVTHLYQIQ